MTIKFTVDELGLDQFLDSADMTRVRRSAADAIVDRAGLIMIGTDYASTLSVEEDSDRVSASTSDPFWHLVEFGSINNDALRPLSRATQDVGCKFTDGA